MNDLPKARHPIRMRAGKWLIVVAAVGAGIAVWLYREPERLADHALARVPDLRPGMTEPEVWRTLGLEGKGLTAWTVGSGPQNAWPSYYPMTKDKMIKMAWDLTKDPPVLLGAQAGPPAWKESLREYLARYARH